jgi:putative photosynthetic complex assembly protein 2
MLESPWIAAVFALFVWWFSTGAILWVVKGADLRGRDAHQWSVILSLPLLVLGVAGLRETMTDDSIYGIYGAFLSALAIWGWIELSFLSGVITGPNSETCPKGISEQDRFFRACGTIAYHEILLTAVLALTLWLSWEAANTFGFWTFAVLYFARISAKLNLFLGVPKINVEFLPGPLAHLPSYFRFARLNALFPASVTALSFAVACWLERIYGAATPADAVGFSLLAALTALALLEHWLMVLPLPDERLWRWMIPVPKTNEKTLLREDGHGL